VKITIITQARFGSSRLPGKVLKKISNSTLLGIHLKRLKKTSFDHSIIVATTSEIESDAIISIAKEENCLYFKGSTDDVLERFYQASLMTDSSHIVRVTSDCPLIDPILVSKVIQYAVENDFNYCMTSEGFPDGVDVEVFKTEELKEAYFNAKLISEREHVTPFIRNKSKLNGSYGEFQCVEGDFGGVRMTVDEQSDFETIEVLVENLGIDKSWNVYANYIISNLNLFDNQQIIRNSGYLKSLKNDAKTKNQ
jgi:spore coat polysaccharide biosynthesis protein SpsF